MCVDMCAIYFSKCFILQTVSYKVARKVGRSFVGEFNTARLLVEVRYNKKRGLCIVHLRPLVTCVIS